MFSPDNDHIPVDPFKPTTYMTGPWIPVTEKLPMPDLEMASLGIPYSQQALIYWADEETGDPIILVGVYDLERKCWHTIPDDEGQYELQRVTHWMPRPDPPERK